MEPDTTILARQATALVWSEPTLTEQPADAGATAQAAHPPAPAAAAVLPEPAEPPDLDRLGNRIAELSARIDAATYELLCYLHQFNQQHGWEGFRSCWLNWLTGSTGAPASTSAPPARSCAWPPRWPSCPTSPRPWPAAGFPIRKSGRCRGWLPLPPRRGCWRWPAVPPRRRWSGWYAAGGRQTRPRRRMASRCAWRAACCSTQVDEDGMLLLRARLTPEVGAVLLRAVEAPRHWSRCRRPRRARTATSPRLHSGVPMRWGWWPRVRWPASSIRATSATASR